VLQCSWTSSSRCVAEVNPRSLKLFPHVRWWHNLLGAAHWHFLGLSVLLGHAYAHLPADLTSPSWLIYYSAQLILIQLVTALSNVGRLIFQGDLCLCYGCRLRHASCTAERLDRPSPVKGLHKHAAVKQCACLMYEIAHVRRACISLLSQPFFLA
jgi:hypothetical protein